MKYQQPFDRPTEPDSSYINGNPSAGIQGSIPPASAFEYPMRELLNIITYNAISPSDSDLSQTLKGIRSQFVNFAEDTGSANSLSVSFNPPILEYTIGLPIRVRVYESNTGTATIDAGAGRVQIKKPDGTPLVEGDLSSGGLVDLVYDGTAFQMINFLGQANIGGGDITYSFQNIPYCVDTSVTPNLITAPFSPAITSLSAGTIFLVKVANTVTGTTTIVVNALSAQSVIALGGDELVQSDINAGDVVLFAYDGVRFNIVPNILIDTNITIHVPSQYATPTAALNAIGRKRIHPSVTVTILLASGIFGPFDISHNDSSRIVIEGTMLSSVPTTTDFSQTGNTFGARTNDAAYNINMLRSRYGTEINSSVGNPPYCISNISPGTPNIKNLLCVIDPNQPGQTSCVLSLVAGAGLICDGVSVHGFSFGGFFCSGEMLCSSCNATGGGNGTGFLCTNGGNLGGYNGNSLGNGNGAVANSGSTLGLTNMNVKFNAIYGAYATNGSVLTCTSSALLYNGYVDAAALFSSYTDLISCAVQTLSPANLVTGNVNSIIFQH